MKKKVYNIEKLMDIMYLLREKCPWDRKQTLRSLISLTIEEVYELQQLIIEDKTKNLKNELGDILMHIIFYCIICEEKDIFDLNDVINILIDKLVNRHPHVFKNQLITEKEVKKNWELLKIKEGKKSILEGVPDNSPSLIRAFRIQDKVSGVGFDFDNNKEVINKIKEEILELEQAILSKNKNNIDMEFGDVLFSLVNYARHIKVDPESALQKSNNKFVSRFKNMELDLDKNRLDFNNIKKEQLSKYWEKQKIKK